MAGNRLFTETGLLDHLVVQVFWHLLNYIVIGVPASRKNFVNLRHNQKIEKAPGLSLGLFK